MPLKLSLKPGERFVLNGAVLENGDRRTNLVLQNHAAILREKDIMQESDVTTPARRVYFPVMLMYLDPGKSDENYEEFVLRMTDFMSAVRNPEMLSQCVGISRDVMAGEFYKALNKCRKLMKYEEGRLAHVTDSVSAGVRTG